MTTLITQLAEEFAQQRLATTRLEGVDPELALTLWRHQALEVLAYAVPRLSPQAVSVEAHPERAP